MKHRLFGLWLLFFVSVLSALGCEAPLSIAMLRMAAPSAHYYELCIRPSQVPSNAQFWIHDRDRDVWISDQEPERLRSEA